MAAEIPTLEISVRCYGPARREAGSDTLVVEVDPPATVGDVLEALIARRGATDGLVLLLPHCAVAIKDELVAKDHPVNDADELALLPPVAGG